MSHKTKTPGMVELRDRIERALRSSVDGWARIETPCTTVEVDAVLREIGTCDWVSYSDDDIHYHTDCWSIGDEVVGDIPPSLHGWRMLIVHAA